MKKKQLEVSPTLVYVVQGYGQSLVSVRSTLSAAFEDYKFGLANGLSQQDRDELTEMYGEDFHEELDNMPCVVVYQLDGSWIWSYDSASEIKNALETGEDYSEDFPK